MPPERFDYGMYVGGDWAGAQDLSCGTCACAIGWMPQVPELQGLGLKYVRRFGSNGGAEVVSDETNDSWDTASYIFDVSSRDVGYLFHPSAYGNPLREDASAKAVAAHIRDFVARGGRPDDC